VSESEAEEFLAACDVTLRCAGDDPRKLAESMGYQLSDEPDVAEIKFWRHIKRLEEIMAAGSAARRAAKAAAFVHDAAQKRVQAAMDQVRPDHPEDIDAVRELYLDLVQAAEEMTKAQEQAERSLILSGRAMAAFRKIGTVLDEWEALFKNDDKGAEGLDDE
jgi:hypothetical protein